MTLYRHNKLITDLHRQHSYPITNVTMPDRLSTCCCCPPQGIWKTRWWQDSTLLEGPYNKICHNVPETGRFWSRSVTLNAVVVDRNDVNGLFRVLCFQPHNSGITWVPREFQITGNSTPGIVLQQRKHRRSVLLAFCDGNPPVAAGIPTQRASNAESFCMSWRHHVHAWHSSRNSAELVISCVQVMGDSLLNTDTFIWSYVAYARTAGSTRAF